MLSWRGIEPDDRPLLARLNRQLQVEEGADVMSEAAIESRLHRWLGSGYQGVVFTESEAVVAYAVYRDTDPDAEGAGGTYLRQFFVVPERRRRGLGRAAIDLLIGETLPPGRRIILEVLATNPQARAFWEAVGFAPYSFKLERRGDDAA